MNKLVLFVYIDICLYKTLFSHILSTGEKVLFQLYCDLSSADLLTGFSSICTFKYSNPVQSSISGMKIPQNRVHGMSEKTLTFLCMSSVHKT